MSKTVLFGFHPETESIPLSTELFAFFFLELYGSYCSRTEKSFAELLEGHVFGC